MSRRTRPSEGAADDTTDDIVGVVRFARTGDASSKALRDGDIAVVDLPDLDRGQAEALVARNVRAVLNAAESSTGRFPNLGPQVLADAGVTLIDHVGAGIWSRLRSGDTVRIADGKVFKDEVLVAQGHMVDDATRSQRLGVAERDLATRLGSLTANASDHLERERELLLEGARIPRLPTRLRGRPVVVVSRTYGWQDDLKRIRRWIRDSGAVVVGVTAGADALIDAKIAPDVVIGHLDDLSDRALRSGADVVVVTSSGRSEGHERFERAGVDVATFTASGRRATSRSCWPTPTTHPSSSRSAHPAGWWSSSSGAPPRSPARSSPGCARRARSSTRVPWPTSPDAPCPPGPCCSSWSRGCWPSSRRSASPRPVATGTTRWATAWAISEPGSKDCCR